MSAAASAAPPRVGRFQPRRLLGRGAQAGVWLAHDPRLDREVALKLLEPRADAAALGSWLHEARAVGGLAHPNVVPLFEADEAGGRPYLVFEYVDGPTLAELRRLRGALPPREAVEMLLGILDALAAAHAQGLVHRDLKPSNVLVGADGRPRVMDFGIAARIDAPGSGDVVGTPGYLSPEAARGEPPTPAMDVFAAGVVLGELLAGAPLVAERDPRRWLQRVQIEDLALPAGVEVDDVLRGIVQRALARDPRQRYDGARAMRDALAAWLTPGDIGDPDAARGRSTIEFLLRRMRHKTDFPALSEAVVRIQRIAASDSESLGSLAAEILKDVALTNKLLRMVNTVHFRHAAGGGIQTISRAVALVGFAGIRNMAMSLVLLEHVQDKAQAALLREEFVHALMAGMVASELALGPREDEEAFLGAMFQNLGRLLAEYYFPEEAQQIRQQLAGGPADAASREAAALRVLGVDLQSLGIGIARAWGLPESLQRAMHAPEGPPPARAVEAGPERLRWLGRAANEITEALLALDGEALRARLGAIAQAHAAALAQLPRQIEASAAQARERMAELMRALDLRPAPGAPSRRLLAAPTSGGVTDSLSPHALQQAAAAAPVASAEMLAAGVQDITNTMVADDFQLNHVLRMVLETMFRALGFQRVVFALRDPKAGQIRGRFGLGRDVERVCQAMRVPLRPDGAVDLFSAVCLKGMDTLITDATAANVASRLPAWYRQSVGAPAFLLLPLQAKGAVFALIYADHAQAGALQVGDKELALLRTLRNQAVMAFRQAGG